MKITMDKEYQTRDGRSVRILAIDGIDEDYPVVGYIKNQLNTAPYTWNASGKPCELAAETCSLVEVPRTITHEFWINVFDDGATGAWRTEEEADKWGGSKRIGPAQKFTVTVEVPQ